MKLLHWPLVVACVALVPILGAGSPAFATLTYSVPLGNYSFEYPGLTSAHPTIAHPATSPTQTWTFVGTSGIARDGGLALVNALPAVPQPAGQTPQAAYLEGDGSFHESFTLPVELAHASLTFWDETNVLNTEKIVATVTGPLGYDVTHTYLPTTTTAFVEQTLSLGLMLPGTYTITFLGDATIHAAFVDNVAIGGTVTPEPGSMLVWGVVIAGIAVCVRRSRKAV